MQSDAEDLHSICQVQIRLYVIGYPFIVLAGSILRANRYIPVDHHFNRVTPQRTVLLVIMDVR
jgi:hypothetical protein